MGVIVWFLGSLLRGVSTGEIFDSSNDRSGNWKISSSVMLLLDKKWSG